MENNAYKILVVDDNLKNIQVIANLLSENHYNVEAALSGAEAVQWVEKTNFDLILLDIMMPEMDGFEVCEKIKQKKKNQDLPIIFLTAKTDVDSISKAFSKGGYDYLTKPFNSDELMARVKTHIELKVSRDKLKEVNKWLEEKVKERTAELIIANNKLLELDNAKSQFLNIISHEIRTPLNGILGMLDLVKSTKLSEETISFISMLDLSAKRLEQFSYKALDISMFNAKGKDAIRVEEANVTEFISKAIHELESKIKNKEINISKTVNTENEIINVDTNYFYKSIYNIIENAINYSPEKGTVSIEVRNQDKDLIVEVRDEGPGFNKEFAINDIAPFNSKDHVDQNPGLSLYLSNQIIKAHGGSIENGNNPDKGAFVKISIPIT